jgi:hypothetical protein
MIRGNAAIMHLTVMTWSKLRLSKIDPTGKTKPSRWISRRLGRSAAEIVLHT